MGDGSEPITLRFPAQQRRYLKVDFDVQTPQPGDRYYTVVDQIAVGGAPESQNALEVYFSAPGDDPQFGAAAYYTVHYAAEAFESEDFATVPDLVGGQSFVWNDPAPLRHGALELTSIDNLAVETQYWFALTATDAAGNVSPVSNVATAQTAYVPPPAVIDLSATALRTS